MGKKDEREKELPFCAIGKVIFELSHYLCVFVCVWGFMCKEKTYKAGTQYELSMFVLERMENK